MSFLPLIAHIETNVDGDLSLDALADVAHMSGLEGGYRAAMARLAARADVDVIGLPAVERYQTAQVLGGALEIVDICLPVLPRRA